MAPVNTAVKEHLVQTMEVVHLDESGMRVEEKLHWVHVASTTHLTYLELNAHRGTQAHDAIGILPQRTGPVVHDFERCYEDRINQGYQANPPPALDPSAPKRRSRVKQSKPKNLLDRLHKDQQAMLHFM